jgi:adenine-specific DNA-methyltransferase
MKSAQGEFPDTPVMRPSAAGSFDSVTIPHHWFFPHRFHVICLPSPFESRMAELIWDGKYDEHGHKRAPVRIELPFQTVETVNESVQERQRTLELSSSGHDPEWRNRLIWGDKKYVLPSLLPEFAGKVDLIYIDPPFDTGADFSFMTTVPDSDELFEKELRS